VALGSSAGQFNQGDQSVAIGSNAGCTGLSEFSVSLGHNSGTNESSSNSKNTYLGASTNCSIGTIITKSTAVGFDATVTASNQIVLGTSTETVEIPGSLGTNLTVTILNLIYPVGSIYMNYISDSNPTILLNWSTSTWVEVKQKTLVGYDSGDSNFNTLGGNGGYANIQPHNHQWYNLIGGDNSAYVIDATNASSGSAKSYKEDGADSSYFSDPLDTISYYTATTITGDSNTATSNYPPYFIVTIWKRSS
jgi:hypothetical protein